MTSSSLLISKHPIEYVKLQINNEDCIFGSCLVKKHLNFNNNNNSNNNVFVVEDLENGIVNLTTSENNNNNNKRRKKTTRTVLFEHNNPCPVNEREEPNINNRVRIGVAVVLENVETHQVLITKRSEKLRSFSGGWVVPGGHVDKGELLAQAAAREVEEEVGIEVDYTELTLLGIWESVYPFKLTKDVPHSHHHCVFYFSLRLSIKDPSVLKIQASEIANILWLDRHFFSYFFQTKNHDSNDDDETNKIFLQMF